MHMNMYANTESTAWPAFVMFLATCNSHSLISFNFYVHELGSLPFPSQLVLLQTKILSIAEMIWSAL